MVDIDLSLYGYGEAAVDPMDCDDDADEFTIDCLPLDCIVCICEYLPANDLGRFTQVCKLFYEASLVGSLWRYHCFHRWAFCDVSAISAGPQLWRRYFLSRRKLEASMERGRPGRDYKVKTLRGHEKDIISACVFRGNNVDWENPHPPLLVSLSSDNCLKAWDISQGKVVWSQEGQGTSAIALDNMLLATGGVDGMVSLWSCDNWALQQSFKTSAGRTILALKFAFLKPTKQKLLMVHVEGNPDNGVTNQLEVWHLPSPPAQSQVGQPDYPPPVLMYQLWAAAHQCKQLKLSSSGLLALPGRIGDVHIWNLTQSPPPSAQPPLPPVLTVNTQQPISSVHWTTPTTLATTELYNINYWDVKSKLDSRITSATVNLYNASGSIVHGFHVSAMAMVNECVIIGNERGEVRVFREGKQTQLFHDHKAAITDIYGDGFRVLTCSKDFSVRIYCWTKSQGQVTLASKYTLLGGSVVNKTHDGFNQLLCEANSCVGVAGNQLKCYTFITPPLEDQKLLTLN